jgi:hypothetical protein
LADLVLQYIGVFSQVTQNEVIEIVRKVHVQPIHYPHINCKYLSRL